MNTNSYLPGPIELYGEELSSLITNLEHLVEDLRKHRTRIASGGGSRHRRISLALETDLAAVGEQCLKAAGKPITLPIINPYAPAK